ncbi:hypothetical protein MG293_019405 [Ovis ammon polii]|uniref:Uncharacterized protein n=1 Tax=Ovis ammon polii TaxID=230172 RepID=A0AAD4Y1Z8_OVIAM|nr:hypothetical protein MG293_019405 [Ovis ammon polii]
MIFLPVLSNATFISAITELKVQLESDSNKCMFVVQEPKKDYLDTWKKNIAAPLLPKHPSAACEASEFVGNVEDFGGLEKLCSRCLLFKTDIFKQEKILNEEEERGLFVFLFQKYPNFGNEKEHAF